MGPTAANPFISTTPATPYIAGLAGGAETYGIVPQTSSLFDALNAASGDLDNARKLPLAPTNAVALVLREAIPAGFDNYSDYDLVLYVNLTSIALAGPRLGMTSSSTNTSFDPALQIGGLETSLFGSPEVLDALPGKAIFATLVRKTDAEFVNAGLSGSFGNISKQALLENTPLYITVPFGTQTVGLQLPGLQAVTATPDGHSVYALSVAKNVLVVANHDLSARQTLAVSGLTAASQVVLSPDGKNIYVTEPGSNRVAVFTRNTTTGNLTALSSITPSQKVVGALAFNAAGTQAFLGGPSGLMTYTRNSDGSLTSPSTLIAPAGLGGVTDLALSQDGHDLYALSQQNNGFVVLNPANLSAAPVASFSGPASGLVGASALAVSHDDQYIYVTGEQGATLAVFQRNLGTNAFTLLQVLQQGVNGVRGLVDANGAVVSTDDKYVYVTGGLGNSLAVFARQANGTLLPAQVLRGTQSLSDPGGIAEDASGVVYVTSQRGLGVEGGGIATFGLVPPTVITAASWSNGTATITAPNDFVVGQPVTIAGVTGSVVPAGYDGTFTITSVLGLPGNQTGFTYALTTNPGTATLNSATVAAAARAYSVLFTTTMDTVTLTAGNGDNTISMIHDPSVAALTLDAGNGSNLVNLLDVPAPGQTPGPKTFTVKTGSGSDQVFIFADPANHTFNINTGAGDDSIAVDGDPNNNASNTFNINLGDGNDVAQINGLDLASSDTMNLDGGHGFDTLFYNGPNHGNTSNFESNPPFDAPTNVRTDGPYTINEGQSLTLNGSATAVSGTQLLGIAWDLNGDGDYGDAVDTSVTFPATSASSHPTLTWAQLETLGLTQGGTYTISMQMTTTTGIFRAYTTLVIKTVPPTITLNAGATANVGVPYTVSFGAVFPGDETATGWTVNWGDHTSTTLPSDATMATHTYTTVGNHTVVAGVTDANGTYDSAGQLVGLAVNVNSLSAGGPYTINAGDSLTLTATAEGDPTTARWDLQGLGTYTAASGSFVSNGDGTSTSTVQLTWAQLQALGITDSGVFSSVRVKAIYPTAEVAAGFLISPRTMLTVDDVAPTATLAGTAQEGGTGSVTFSKQASFVQTTGFLYSYDVGNTGTFQVTGSSNPTFAIPASYLYQSGSLVVRGRVTDKHGLFTDVIITFPVANQSPMFVSSDADKTVNENAVVSLSNVRFSDPGQDVITASINWGDNTSSQGVVTTTNTKPAPTTGTVAGSHTYAYRSAPYTVTITLRDDNGATAMRSFQVTVLAPPLSVTAGPSGQTVTEGDPFSLTGATFNDPGAPHTYTATVNWGDGSPTDTNATVNAPATAADSGHVFDSHTFGHPGAYTVTISVKEPNQPAVSNTFTLTVLNAAPTVDAGADIPAGPGVPVHINATFSDPSFPSGGAQETYKATIDWGDSTTSAGNVTVTPGSSGVPTTGTVAGTHTYSGTGPYTVRVTVSDGAGSGSDALLVTDAPPTVNPGADLTGNEGSPVNLHATFSDLGFNFGGATKSFKATIDWGDNTTSSGTVTVVPGSAGVPTTGTIAGSHVYTAFGTYPVTIQLADEAGAAGQATLNAVIQNLPPTIDPLSVGSFYPGGEFVLNAAFKDPGLGDTHTVTIDWGDGRVSQVDANTLYAGPRGALLPELVEPTATGEHPITTGHVYSGVLSHTITLTVTDDGGASAKTSISVSAARVTTTAQTAVTSFSSVAKMVTLSATLVDQTHPADLVNQGTVTFTVEDSRHNTIGSPVAANIRDGTASASFSLPAAQAPGVYSVLVRYNDGLKNLTDSGETGSTLTVSPAEVTTTASAASALFSAVGQNILLSATVVDTNDAADVVNEGIVTFTVEDSKGQTVGSPVQSNVMGGLASATFSLPAGQAAGAYQVLVRYSDGLANYTDKSDVSGALIVSKSEADLLHDVHVRQVAALYKALAATLPPVPAGPAWVAALDGGATLVSVARGIARSPESARRMTIDIYRQYLRRAPTAAELSPLLPLARRGRFDLVRANVLGSAAYFKERAHSSSARFLNVLAADVLGKKLDPHTKASLAAKRAKGATRTELALALLATQPSRARIAQQLAHKYGAARDQARDTRELATALALGASERDVILLLVLQRGLPEANPT